MQQTCPGCGARIARTDVSCDLCGTDLSDVDLEFHPDASGDREGPSPLLEKTEHSNSGEAAIVSPELEPSERSLEILFCNQCGARNPVGSRFCSSCGTPIIVLSDMGSARRVGQKAPPVPASHGAKVSGSSVSETVRKAAPGEEGAARRVGIIVGSGILLVLVWYMTTLVVKNSDSSSNPSLTGQFAATSGPLAPQFRESEAALIADIAGLNGEARAAKQRELVDLYVSANRLDLAAAEAEKVAEFENNEDTWVATANLYYDWMELSEPQNKALFAKRSIAAYRRALEINPENLDARTDMAIAYMYDPDNPMLAIQETMKVLEYDSLHVNANFNRAIMLLQINRIDQALEQLEKVKQIVNDPADPVYLRAQQVIAETLAKSNS